MSAEPTAGALDWPTVLTRLMAGSDLDSSTAQHAMREIMAGGVSPARIAGFLVALRAKGESVAEMAGLSQAMRELAQPLLVPGPCVDIVGTGGDRSNTVNISTMAAIVMAAAGARVVKHGNRAASSQCGSADLLEQLGVNLEAEPQVVADCAQQVGITFCFAPRFHPAMRHVAPTRRDLGVPTAFNFLGPLTNPAAPGHAALGVADTRMAGLLAGVLAEQGVQALVFRGDDGLDELTTATTSAVWVVTDGQVSRCRLDPAELGIARSAPGALTGGDREHNAAVARAVFAGELGPVRDAVVLNAAAGLASLRLAELAAHGSNVLAPHSPHAQIAPPAPVPVHPSLGALLSTTIGQAAHAIDSGGARDTLQRWVAFHVTSR